MGCDIHFYVERRENGQWVSADTWTPNPYYEEGSDEELPTRIAYEDRFYASRNYNLFAILANVRNGYGFVGVKTSDRLIPIALPRGLPDDISPEVCAESDRWGEDGHSHSWFLVKELLNYNWIQTVRRCGYVDLANYRHWRWAGKPKEWCGGVDGPGVRVLSNEEMNALLEERNDEKYQHTYYTWVEWGQTYASVCDRFLSETLPKLQALGDPSTVRIVFWFDN